MTFNLAIKGLRRWTDGKLQLYYMLMFEKDATVSTAARQRY